MGSSPSSSRPSSSSGISSSAIGTGISAGVAALEISAVLTVFFCYSTLYVYYVGDGLESHYEAHRKAVKQARKAAEARQTDERSGM